jgi:hypothetical protein
LPRIWWKRGLHQFPDLSRYNDIRNKYTEIHVSFIMHVSWWSKNKWQVCNYSSTQLNKNYLLQHTNLMNKWSFPLYMFWLFYDLQGCSPVLKCINSFTIVCNVYCIRLFLLSWIMKDRVVTVTFLKWKLLLRFSHA